MEVDNSAESGIIKLNTELKSLSNLEAYSSRGIDIPYNLKSYLEKLKSSGDYVSGQAGSFTMNDVSVLSKETGVEFACVTVGDQSYLIRGDETGTNIPKNIFDEIIKNNGTLDFHSHPHDGENIPSASDLKVIAMLENVTGQDTSKIITTDGKITLFNKYGVISIETADNTMTDECKKMLEELFGGE